MAGAGGAAPEAMMGKEEEIARIARRLDKMVTKKSAVRGAGRQDPGTPAPPSPPSPRQGRGDYPTGRARSRRWPSRAPAPFQPCPSAPHPRLGRNQAWTLSGSHRSGLRPQLHLGPAPSPFPTPDPEGRPAMPFLGPAPPGLGRASLAWAPAPQPSVPHPLRPAVFGVRDRLLVPASPAGPQGPGVTFQEPAQAFPCPRRTRTRFPE